MLKLEQVSTAYDGVPMLQDVDLNVADGELVTLLGPNGAGKTTTFRAITGIVQPQKGRVTVDDEDISRTAVNRRVAELRIGVVPEGRRLFPKLTVRENLRLAYQLNDSDEPFEKALQPIADRFSRVAERLDQYAGTLSGGEQAMVALARALIINPRYLIMDEPSLGLAPNLVEEYFALVESLKGAGRAILLIEQNIGKSLAIADRAYVLKKGRVAFAGDASELRDSAVAGEIYFGG